MDSFIVKCSSNLIWYWYTILNLPSHVKYLWMTLCIFSKHSSMWLLGTPLDRLSPWYSGLKNYLEKEEFNDMDLNYFSPQSGIFVVAEIEFSETSNSNIPTLVFVPLKLSANSLATSGCPLCIFWQKLRQPTLWKASLNNGSYWWVACHMVQFSQSLPPCESSRFVDYP